MNNRYLLFCLTFITSALIAQEHKEALAHASANNSCQQKQLLETFMHRQHALLEEDKALLDSYVTSNHLMWSRLKKVCAASFPISFIGFYTYSAMQRKDSDGLIRKYDVLDSLLSATSAMVVIGSFGLGVVTSVARKHRPIVTNLQEKINTREGVLTELKQHVLEAAHEDRQ